MFSNVVISQPTFTVKGNLREIIKWVISQGENIDISSDFPKDLIPDNDEVILTCYPAGEGKSEILDAEMKPRK